MTRRFLLSSLTALGICPLANACFDSLGLSTVPHAAGFATVQEINEFLNASGNGNFVASLIPAEEPLFQKILIYRPAVPEVFASVGLLRDVTKDGVMNAILTINDDTLRCPLEESASRRKARLYIESICGELKSREMAWSLDRNTYGFLFFSHPAGRTAFKTFRHSMPVYPDVNEMLERLAGSDARYITL